MSTRALIFDIQDLSVQDGPGIRTTVFMKGCPLKCKWCSNPEGQKPYPELMHINALCKKSYHCLSACPYKSVSIESASKNNFPKFERDKCKDCETRKCINSCPSNAIKFAGKYISLEELIKRVKPNLSYYKNSGGGVTFSGGEPFLQTGFIKEFIEHTFSFGLSVGVETCGMFDWSEVREIADKFDFFYFDFKCMDSDIHKNVTGSSNEKILTNLKNLAENYSEKITISVPVIPGVNDSEMQIKAIAEYCKSIEIKNLRLLPYHSLGSGKYYDLGREYTMNQDLSVPANQLNEFKSLFESYGIFCNVEF
jgi:pyruvate formate lyase activating enzyme